MQSVSIVKSVEPLNTFNSRVVRGMFDISEDSITETFNCEIDIDFDWNIGIIVGNSGTGKSTIAKDIFKSEYFIDQKYSNEPIIDSITKSRNVQEIIKILSLVGFASPKSWLKPYDVLSNGEKMRVDVARAILSDGDIIVFDEFTSVVDRTVAQISSLSIQKSIRRDKRKFVAISCHYDIIEYLQPDWILDTTSMRFSRPDKKKLQNSNYQYMKQEISQRGTFLRNITI